MHSLTEFQEQVGEWARRNFPNAEKWEPLLGAVEELGELAHAHLKIHQSIRLNEQLQEKREDAVGDIIVYLAHYCELCGINLDDCVTKTWSQVEQRDWKKFPINGKTT